MDYKIFNIPLIYDVLRTSSGFLEDDFQLKSIVEKDDCKKSRMILYSLIYKILNKKKFEINISQFGKPYLNSNLGLNFNLSHSESKIILIFSQRSIGIDIEVIKATNFQGKEKFFTTDEKNYIFSSTNISDAFYEIWTLKEAYLKYLGIGLNRPLTNINVTVLGKNDYMIFDQGKILKLMFNSFEIEDDSRYRISICSENPISPNVINLN